MVPPNLFHSKAISNNLVRLPMEADISPDSLFPIKPIFFHLLKPPETGGNDACEVIII